MRIGIYGGSFDPVHFGHLLLAETARVERRLDRVDFIPLGVPPHLKNVRTSGELRFQMLLAALAPYSDFSVSRFEIDSPKVSFTADTLEYYRECFPNDELFLILSSETLNDLPNWRCPERICELASLLVARRAGYAKPDFDALSPFTSAERIELFRSLSFSMPLQEISSTELRARIAAGLSVRFQTPDSVIDIIQTEGLYKK